MTMNNSTLYAPVYEPSVMMHDVVFHDNDGNENQRTYTYKAAIALEVGDTVIMQARGWYSVGTVKKVNVGIPFDSDVIYRWIVAKVDLHAGKTLMEWEAELIDEIHRRRAENMRVQLIEHLGVQPNQLTTLLSYDDDERMTDAKTDTD